MMFLPCSTCLGMTIYSTGWFSRTSEFASHSPLSCRPKMPVVALGSAVVGHLGCDTCVAPVARLWCQEFHLMADHTVLPSSNWLGDWIAPSELVAVVFCFGRSWPTTFECHGYDLLQWVRPKHWGATKPQGSVRSSTRVTARSSEVSPGGGGLVWGAMIRPAKKTTARVGCVP